MISLNNMSKSFKKNSVLNSISLELEEGKIIGILGRSAVGKTTLFNIISGYNFQTEGEVLIDNEVIWENKDTLSKIFYAGPDTVLPKDKLSQQLMVYNSLIESFDYDKAITLCEKYKISLSKRTKHLSTGELTMYRNILALCSNKEILLFDEPNLGLDAYNRVEFYKEVLDVYAANENTILISSHSIDELTNIIEQVVILNEGTVATYEDTQALLSNSYSIEGNIADIEEIAKHYKTYCSSSIGNRSRVSVINVNIDNIDISNLVVEKLSLQDIFICITGGGLND